VNHAIEECLFAGTMGATCVMTNMALYADAASLRRKFPQRSIGIHWNITQGSPVSKPSAVPSLVGTDGLFSRELRRRWLARQVIAPRFRAELRAQYERFVAVAEMRTFGTPIKTAMCFPGCFNLFVDVGSELIFPRCARTAASPYPKEAVLTRYLLSPSRLLAQRPSDRPLGSSRPKRAAHACPMGGFIYRVTTPDLTLLREIAERLPWQKISGAVEWVVHPASRIDDKLLGA
jgi:hypothetical protein